MTTRDDHINAGAMQATPAEEPMRATVLRALNLVQSAMCLSLREQLSTRFPAEWDKGTDLLESDDPEEQRLGVVYLLYAMAHTSNSGQVLAQQLLHDLGVTC